MRRFFHVLLACLLAAGLLAGCGSSPGAGAAYVDGTYEARFKNPSSNEYIDYLKVTVSGGLITGMEYDAFYQGDETQLRSADETYERDMDKVSGTYPRRYGPDLVNQYLESGSIGEVDDIAGATWSSACFKALFAALEPGMLSGSTELVLVDNVPEL